MKTFLVLLLAMSVGCAHKNQKESTVISLQTPIIVFTVEDVSHPESALYSSAHKVIFVSNVASGNPVETKRLGYISKVSPNGKMIKAQWVKGLKAPKGLAVVGNFLYASDVDQVVKIDIKRGRVLKTVTIPGAKFLNDVTADKDGNVYISDMMTDTIHVWNKKGMSVWLHASALRSPNGLYTDGTEHILLASWGNPIDPKNFATQELGAMSALSLKNTNDKIIEDQSVRGNLDGISADNEGNVWISDWMNGDVYKIKKNGPTRKMYNFGQGTADISYAKELNLLLVPQMGRSKLFALKVE